MTVMQLPAEVKFGKVVGRWIRTVPDLSTDPDELPNAVPVVGTGVITRAVKEDKMLDDVQNDGTWVDVISDQILVVLNSDGELCLPHAQDKPGVWLVTGDYVAQMSFAWKPMNFTVTELHTAVNPFDLLTLGV